jgi:hypothetical protein
LIGNHLMSKRSIQDEASSKLHVVHVRTPMGHEGPEEQSVRNVGDIAYTLTSTPRTKQQRSSKILGGYEWKAIHRIQ